MPFRGSYEGKRVLVTGDTGFKGSWLCEWLLTLGAEVSGIGLEPDTEPAIFETLGLRDRIDHETIDIRDRPAIHEAVARLQPDVVFHLAAQALVRRSYAEPLDTLETNIIGTANLLSAAHQASAISGKECSVVVVTSDKCYDNDESGQAFAEDHPMGGSDIYSASKGAAEIVVGAWIDSFLSDSRVTAATCRAGNVIGGGDWAQDRIVPDSMRSLLGGETIPIRNPQSVRPWQHVLEPLSGYLLVGSLLPTDPSLDRAWNFGPGPGSQRTVADLVDAVIRHWGSGSWKAAPLTDGMHESILLHLSIDKAIEKLGWHPVWDFDSTVAMTTAWYRDARSADAGAITRSQIARYEHDAADLGLAWSDSNDG